MKSIFQPLREMVQLKGESREVVAQRRIAILEYRKVRCIKKIRKAEGISLIFISTPIHFS